MSAAAAAVAAASEESHGNRGSTLSSCCFKSLPPRGHPRPSCLCLRFKHTCQACHAGWGCITIHPIISCHFLLYCCWLGGWGLFPASPYPITPAVPATTPPFTAGWAVVLFPFLLLNPRRAVCLLAVPPCIPSPSAPVQLLRGHSQRTTRDQYRKTKRHAHTLTYLTHLLRLRLRHSCPHHVGTRGGG